MRYIRFTSGAGNRIERDRPHSGGARPGRRVLAALKSRQLQDRAGKVRGRLVEIGG